MGTVTGIVLGWACLTASAGEPVALTLKYQVGKRYLQRMEMTQTGEIQMAAGATPMQQQMTQTMDFSFAVLKERPEGGQEIEVTYKGVKMSMKFGGMAMAFDSTKDASQDAGNPMASSFRGMVGSKIKLFTDATGKVAKVEGIEKMVGRMTANNPAAARQVKQMINPKAMKNMFAQMMGAGLPGKPVSPGDTWDQTMDLAMGAMLNMVTRTTYTFEKWDTADGRRCALIAYKGKMASKPLPPNAAAMMTMTVKDGTTVGKTWFDPELGWAIRTVTNNNVDMDMKISQPAAGNRPAVQRRMSMKMKQRITISLLKIVDLQ